MLFIQRIYKEDAITIVTYSSYLLDLVRNFHQKIFIPRISKKNMNTSNLKKAI